MDSHAPDWAWRSQQDVQVVSNTLQFFFAQVLCSLAFVRRLLFHNSVLEVTDFRYENIQMCCIISEKQ